VPEDLGFPYLGYTPPVVPDGDRYEAIFIKSEQASFAGQPKVYLKFRLVSPSGFLEEEFYMACNVAARGRWRTSSKFYRSWVLANGKRPIRGDRLSISVFKGKVFQVRMRRVEKDYRQNPLPPENQYSVIDSLIKVLEKHEAKS